MAEELFLRVKIIKDDVCIGGAAGREDDDLGNGCQIPDELCAMRTNADACLSNIKGTDMVEPPSTGKSSFTV